MRISLACTMMALLLVTLTGCATTAETTPAALPSTTVVTTDGAGRTVVITRDRDVTPGLVTRNQDFCPGAEDEAHCFPF